MKKVKLVEIIGWYGVIAILAAYALVSFKIITVDSLPYQLLNLTGAVGIVVVSIAKKDKQPVALNIVWACVALIAIARILF